MHSNQWKRHAEWVQLRPTLKPADLMDRAECVSLVHERTFKRMLASGRIPPPIFYPEDTYQLWLRSEVEPVLRKYINDRRVRKHLRAWKRKYDEQEGSDVRP